MPQELVPPDNSSFSEKLSLNTGNSGLNRPQDNSSLHLPRLLCLHGGGTNALIFHAQCRVIRARLGKQFRFVFVDAPYFSHPGPDVESVYAEWLPFRSWRRPGHTFDDSRDFSYTDKQDIDRIDRCLALALEADDKAGATGAWSGLVGFSQGANLAASLLRRQQSWKRKPRPLADTEPASSLYKADFRFAVLMAGCGPLLWMRSDMMDPDELEREKRERLYLSTLHVHGLRDNRIAMHRELLEYCKAETVRLLEWDGDHRVPIRSSDVAALVEQVVEIAFDTGVLVRN
ncbi:hypothetical protein ACHAPI_011653 [Fusarium lateritium]